MYAAVDLSTLPRGGRPDLPATDETTALQVIKMMLDRGANPNIQLKLRPPFRNVIFDRGSDNAVLTIGATPLLRASKAGDNPEAMKCVGFMVTLQRGTEWAATGKVTQKVPANFPTPNTVSYRSDLAAMDPLYKNGLNNLDGGSQAPAVR